MDFLDIEAEGIFTCCGNQYWKPDPSIVNISAELVYENKFELPEHLEMFLRIVLSNSPYPHRYGNHIEDRGSMVNFSIVGRNCTQEQREHFFKWDNEKGERKKISTFLKHKFKYLDAVLGGQISIDIYPKGMDKSQIFKYIEEKENPDEYYFIGVSLIVAAVTAPPLTVTSAVAPSHIALPGAALLLNSLTLK